MKIYAVVIIFTLVLFQNCSSNYNSDYQSTEISDTIVNLAASYNIFDENSSWEQEVYNQVFPYILNNTRTINPGKFIRKLGEYYRLEHPDNTSIAAYGKHRIFGSDQKIWFVNCKSVFKDESCDYPTLYTQFLFNAQGRLIYKNHAEIAEFVPLMKGSVPLFMSVERDCKGNGQHHFYMYENGKIIDVFNVLMNDTPKTYDCNPHSGMFENKHLNLQILDIDNDGHNDIRLSGNWLTPENTNKTDLAENAQFRSKSVTYSFLYKPIKEFFILQY